MCTKNMAFLWSLPNAQVYTVNSVFVCWLCLQMLEGGKGETEINLYIISRQFSDRSHTVIYLNSDN